jgi:hypothetical protein
MTIETHSQNRPVFQLSLQGSECIVIKKNVAALSFYGPEIGDRMMQVAGV